MTKKIAIAIVGIGKIARDQHVPAIAHSNAFELVAAASPSSTLEGVRCCSSIEQLFETTPNLSAVALYTTPQVRYQAARYALARGCHVLLEEPPGATLSEVQALVELAGQRRSALFASWHSRHASAVEPARWRAGSPSCLIRRTATRRSPHGCCSPTPVARRSAWSLIFGTSDRRAGTSRRYRRWPSVAVERWQQHARQDRSEPTAPNAEYPHLYEHFATLVRSRQIDVDVAPMRLVADALLCGWRIEVEPFVDR